MNHAAMIQKAFELKRGAHVGCTLTIQHNGADGSKFVAYTMDAGKIIKHTLDAANTTQERLNAHWLGFVQNREALGA